MTAYYFGMTLAEAIKVAGAPLRRIRPGNALDDVFVHAGKPGDKELKLIVDDVRLIGLD